MQKNSWDDILSNISSGFQNLGSSIGSKATQLGSSISQGFQQLRQPTQAPLAPLGQKITQGIQQLRQPVPAPIQIRTPNIRQTASNLGKAQLRFEQEHPLAGQFYRGVREAAAPIMQNLANQPVAGGLAGNLFPQLKKPLFSSDLVQKYRGLSQPERPGFTSAAARFAGETAAYLPAFAATEGMFNPITARLASKIPQGVSLAGRLLTSAGRGAIRTAPLGLTAALPYAETPQERLQRIPGAVAGAAAVGAVAGPVFTLAGIGLKSAWNKLVNQQRSVGGTLTPTQVREWAKGRYPIGFKNYLNSVADEADKLGKVVKFDEITGTTPTKAGRILKVEPKLNKVQATFIDSPNQIGASGGVTSPIPYTAPPTVPATPTIPTRPSIFPEVPSTPPIVSGTPFSAPPPTTPIPAQFRVVEPPVTGIQPREVIQLDKTKYEGVQTANAIVRPDGTGSIAIELKPEAQGKGLGTELVKELETILKDKGVTQVEIASVPESVGFWEKQGYVQTGQPAQAGLVNMQKALEAEPAGLKVEQASEKQITVEEATQAMGTLFSEEEIQFLTRGAKDIVTPDGKLAMGKTVGSIVEVVENKGKVSEKTVYHEGFHAYTQNFADPNLKQGAIEEAKSQQGFKTDQEAEEWLADSFADFMGARQTFTGRILSFFTNLWYSIRSLIGKVRQSEQLFRDIIDRKRPTITPEAISTELATQYQTIPGGRVPTFMGFQDLTTKIVERLKGKAVVSKQFIEDLTNMPELKQPERELIRSHLVEFGDQVPVKDFVDAVKKDLLPLEVKSGKTTEYPPSRNALRYENITLPNDLRGPVADYDEHLYSSPIETSAGQIHFPGETFAISGEEKYPPAPRGYFAHTRVEDLPDSSYNDPDAIVYLGENNYGIKTPFGEILDETTAGSLDEAIVKLTSDFSRTRRVIEIQSDLFQKGRLEDEFEQAVLDIRHKLYTVDLVEKYFKPGKIVPSYGGNDEVVEFRRFTNSFGDEDWKVDVRQIFPDGSKGRLRTHSTYPETKDLNKFILENKDTIFQKEWEKATAGLQQLQPYRNTWQERIIKEEIKQAAKDGKTKLQFPTGETAMKIEGLGERTGFTVVGQGDLTVETIKKGLWIWDGGGQHWVITENLGDGKFKATSFLTATNNYTIYQTFKNRGWLNEQGEFPDPEKLTSEQIDMLDRISEEFDISGKVDTENPIYKFYEKEVGRYLTNKYGANKVTDPQGVEWYEIDIKPEQARQPVEAFRRYPEGQEPVSGTQILSLTELVQQSPTSIEFSQKLQLLEGPKRAAVLQELAGRSPEEFYNEVKGITTKPTEEIVEPEEIPETPTTAITKQLLPQEEIEQLIENIPADPVGARQLYDDLSANFDLPPFEELEQTASQVVRAEMEIVDELKKEAGASDITQLDQIGQFASIIRKAVREYKQATKRTGVVDIATMTEKNPELDGAINALKSNGIEVSTMEDLAALVPRLPIWRAGKAGIRGVRVGKSMTARLKSLIASGATPEQLLAELDNPMSATRQTLRKVILKRRNLTNLVELGLKPEPKMITKAEDVLLRTKLRAEAKGARAGFQEGKTITREELIDKFRTKITDMKQAKQDVVDYIKGNLPIGERGRFIEMVKNVNTQTGVIKAFVKIDKHVGRYERKQLVDDIKQRIIRITDSPSVDVRLKQVATSLLENVELIHRSPGKLAELKATKEYIERQFAQGQDVQMPKRVLKAIDILSKKPIEEITIRDLQTIVGELQLAENLGRFKFTSRKIEYDTEKRLKLDEVVKDAQPIETISELRVPVGEKLSLGQKLKNRFINLANEIKRERMALTPMDVVIDMLDGSKRYTGANYRIFKATLDADFGSFLDNLFSTKNSFAELKKKLDLKEANFERIGVYAARVQEGGVQKLLDTGLSIEEINSVKLTKNEITMYQYMRSEMDKIKPLVDAFMVDNYNQEVGTVDNYFSFMSDFDAMKESEIVQRFGGMINAQGLRTKSPEKGFTKQRTLGTQKIKIDAEEVFLQHMENVHYLLNLGRDTKMLFEIANSPKYKEAVGDRGQKIMLDWLDLIARKGGADGASIIPIFDFFRKNIGAGILGFRLSTILIQPTALINSMSEIGSRYATEGATRVATSREWRRFLVNNIPEFRARGGDDPAFTELSEIGFIKKFQEKGLALMKFADLFTAGSTAGGAYLKKLAELGKPLDLANPDPEALQYAALIMRRTQASPFFKDVPMAISRGALTGSRSVDKMFLQFQSFLLNQWSQIEHDIIRLGIKEKNPVAAARRLTWIILAVVAASGTGIAAKEIVSGLISLATGKVEDKDEEKNAFAERLTRDAIGIVPFVGQIVNAMYYDSFPVPVIETLSRAIGGGAGLVTAKTEEGKINAAIRFTEGVGSLAGISGISQIGQVLRMGKKFVPEEEAALNQLLRMPAKQKDKLDKEAQRIYEKIKKSPDQAEDQLTNALQTNPELYKKILDLDLNEQTGLLDIEKKIDKINGQIGNLKSGITKGAIPMERGLEAIDYLQQQQLNLMDSIKNKPSKSQTLKLPEKKGLVGIVQAAEPTVAQNLMMQKMRQKIQDDQAKLIAELKGETTFANNKIIYPDKETGNAKIIDLNPLLTEKTGLEKAKQQSDIYKTSRDIYNLSELTDEQKNQAYNMLGVKTEDVAYDALASENAQVKATYLEDFLTGKSYDEILTTLKSNRLESISGDMITNDATLDELVERGVISYEDGKELKKYKFTMDKQGNIKNIGSSARAKPKKITFPKLSFKKVSLPKPTPIKVVSPKTFKPLQIKINKIPKPPSVRFTSSQFNIKTPSIRFPKMAETLGSIGKVA